MIYLTEKTILYSDDLELSQLMVDRWANFISSGDPNFPKNESPIWYQYEQIGGEFYFELNKQPRLLSDFTSEYTAAIQDYTSSAAKTAFNLAAPIFLIFLLFLRRFGQ
jgi:carboxylesterase type B